MGTVFSITTICEDNSYGYQSIEASILEIRRIEQLISSWDSASQTSMINRSAGIKPVIVDQELFLLIERSKKVSELTNGAFDISYGSMDKIWQFDGSMTKAPTQKQINNSVSKVGFEKIILDSKNNSVYLPEKGMKIGFGAIGKGYAADRVRILLQNRGIESGIINAAGDLLCWGKPPNENSWRIGIADPNNSIVISSWLNVSDQAIVTSGNYEKYILLNDKKYAHIINPKTGYPVTGLKSVTVICSSAELSDALATGIFVLGQKEGIQLINQLEGIECIIINNKNEFIFSENLELNPYSQQQTENISLKIGAQ